MPKKRGLTASRLALVGGLWSGEIAVLLRASGESDAARDPRATGPIFLDADCTCGGPCRVLEFAHRDGPSPWMKQ